MATIAVDIDGVLADYAATFAAVSNSTWGSHLMPANYTDDWASYWGVEPSTARARAPHMLSAEFYGGLGPMPGAVAGVAELARSHSLVVLTSRSRDVEGVTVDWLRSNFDGCFSHIVFLDAWKGAQGASARSRLKGSLASALGAVALIDDQRRHCEDAARFGVLGIQLSVYAQPDRTNSLESLVECATWQEVLEVTSNL